MLRQCKCFPHKMKFSLRGLLVHFSLAFRSICPNSDLTPSLQLPEPALAVGPNILDSAPLDIPHFRKTLLPLPLPVPKPTHTHTLKGTGQHFYVLLMFVRREGLPPKPHGCPCTSRPASLPRPIPGLVRDLASSHFILHLPRSQIVIEFNSDKAWDRNGSSRLLKWGALSFPPAQLMRNHWFCENRGFLSVQGHTPLRGSIIIIMVLLPGP